MDRAVLCIGRRPPNPFAEKPRIHFEGQRERASGGAGGPLPAAPSSRLGPRRREGAAPRAARGGLGGASCALARSRGAEGPYSRPLGVVEYGKDSPGAFPPARALRIPPLQSRRPAARGPASRSGEAAGHSPLQEALRGVAGRRSRLAAPGESTAPSRGRERPGPGPDLCAPPAAPRLVGRLHAREQVSRAVCFLKISQRPGRVLIKIRATHTNRILRPVS